MSTVTARKIRDVHRGEGHRGEGRGEGGARVFDGGGAVGRSYSGFLVGRPVVGRGMVIFRDPNGHRMITTPVRRVLSAGDGDTLWVETDNSVYRLEFHEVPAASNAA